MSVEKSIANFMSQKLSPKTRGDNPYKENPAGGRAVSSTNYTDDYFQQFGKQYKYKKTKKNWEDMLERMNRAGGADEIVESANYTDDTFSDFVEKQKDKSARPTKEEWREILNSQGEPKDWDKVKAGAMAYGTYKLMWEIGVDT
jgi:hypothetical protein